MISQKPQKIIYENQQEIHDLVLNELKEYLKEVKKAYLIGSLANRKFGKYIEKYEGHYGSDVDVVIIPIKINKKWKYKEEFHWYNHWYKEYIPGNIEIKDIVHPISFLVPLNNNIELFWELVKNKNLVVEKLNERFG